MSRYSETRECAKEGKHSHPWADAIAILSGLLSFGIGLFVLTGWHTHRIAFIFIRPNFAPMQYYSALAFFLSGLGILSLLSNHYRLSKTFGVVIVSIGIWSVLEYLLPISLELSKFFLSQFPVETAALPKLMPTNGILAMTLTGLSLIFLSSTRKRAKTSLLLDILGVIIFTLGFMAFLGYLTGIETTFGEEHWSRLAIHSTWGFMALGLGILALNWHTEKTAEDTAHRWIPVIAGVAIFVACAWIWQELLELDHIHIKRAVQTETIRIRNQIDAQLEARTFLLIRMVSRWQIKDKITKEDWESDARLHVRHFPGLQAIKWVNSSFSIQWLVPYEGNAYLMNSSLARSPEHRHALELARDRQRPYFTDPYDLDRGGKGFSIYVPIYDGKNFMGFMGGVFRVQKFLDEELRNVAPKYSIAVWSHGSEIYRRENSVSGPEERWKQKEDLELKGTTWRLEVWPRSELVSEMRSPLPGIILAFGLLMGLSVAASIYLAQMAKLRARQVESINVELRKEITERTRIEEELREMGIAMENAVDGISRLNTRGYYLVVNRAYAEMLGYTPEELIGKEWQTVIPAEDRGKIFNAEQQMLSFGKIELEAKALRKDGSTFHIQAVLVRSCDKKNNYVGHFFFMKDITERKLQETLEIKSEFISMASHELRTPLQAIKEGLGIVLDGSVGPITSEQRDFLKISSRNVERLTRLINDALDFQKLDAGKTEFVLENHNLNDLIHEVAETMAPLIKNKNLELKLALGNSLPPILMDKDRMTQVLLNLLNNAVKFTAHGSITVTTNIGLDHLKVAIKDTGIGIRENDLPRLFKSFGQIDHGKSLKHVGTGLGLAISKKIIEQHNGSIWAESQFGSGSTFIFVLPVTTSA